MNYKYTTKYRLYNKIGTERNITNSKKINSEDSNVPNLLETNNIGKSEG